MFYDGGGTFLGGTNVRNKEQIADMIKMLKPRITEVETATIVYKNGKLKNIIL